MPAPASFDYAVIVVVPRVDRGERINAGVILYCRARDYLAAAVELDATRLRALDANVDVEAISAALGLIPMICAGDPRSGPIGRLPQADRFHWLVAPRSTVTQTSAVHTGLCADPHAALDDLLTRMVRTA